MAAALFNILIVFLFSVQFVVIGVWLIEGMGGTVFHNIYLRLSGSFFVGMAVYLAAWRTLALFVRSFRVSFWILFVLCICFYFVERRDIGRQCAGFGVKLAGTCILAWIVNILHQMLTWIVDIENNGVQLYSSLGSSNAMRYINLIQYFVENDRIPTINQSYGQSMLGSICCMFGIENSAFALSLWLSMSKAMMLLFLYGIMKEFFSRSLSALMAAAVFLGSVSLTPYPMEVLDTGSPFAYNGYTDSIAGACIFAIYLRYLYCVLEEFDKMNWRHFIFSTCLFAYCCMSAPQNVVVIAAVGFVFILMLICKKEYTKVRKSFIVLAMLVPGLILGVCEGGMLTLPPLIQSIDVSGVMQVGKEGKTIALMPTMAYFVNGVGGLSSDWSYNWSYMKEIMDYAVEGLHSGHYGFCLYHLSILAWDSIRVIFWALLGVAGVGLAAYHRKDKQSLFWGISGVVTLAVGYVITFFFSYNGYKKELVRFMLPAYFLGMIFAVIVLGKLWERQKAYRIVSILSVFLILAGQVPYRILGMISTIQNYDVWNCIRQMILFKNQYTG